MLTVLGCEVIEAEDGHQAVQMVQQEQPDLGLVISDFQMSGMDGVETLKVLGRLRPGLKSILCSGMPKEDCFQGRTLENCTYLGNPYGLHDLDEAMNRVLDRVVG